MPDHMDVYDVVPYFYCFHEFRVYHVPPKKTFLWIVRTMMRFFQEALFHAGSAKKYQFTMIPEGEDRII